MTRSPTSPPRPDLRAPTFAALCALAALGGCAAEEPAVHLAPPAALVVTSDFDTGAYAAIGLADHQVARNIEVIHEDATCRVDPYSGRPLIVARLGADAIAAVDPAAGWEVITEYSVGAGGNAQDVAVVNPERAYVALLAEPALSVVHPQQGTLLDTIDLAAYADADGIPEVASLLERDGKLYATLLRLDAFQPTDHSLLLTLDASSGAVESALPTTVTNPSGKLRYCAALDGLLLVESGVFGALDGGIELFDPATGTLSGLLVTEATLGGDVIDAVIATPTLGYAAIGETLGAAGNTRVVRFDPQTGERLGDLLVADEWSHSTLELSPDGSELWVADRTSERPGIRIFDAATGAARTDRPIDVGLPPAAICFVE